MRVGDFGVEVIASGAGRIRELASGHVLARAGQVYRLRLRNYGPLYCVTEVDIDGHRVTAGGLVLKPWGTTELERPIDGSDHGCFTVVAEGNETVFGPDGGRDDPALGLIEARFRRELPRHDRHSDSLLDLSLPERPLPTSIPDMPRSPSRIPIAPPEWVPSFNRTRSVMDASGYRSITPRERPGERSPSDAIERAAGTGLTGHSDQQFVPISLGPLETEATLIQLRLTIGTEEALNEAEPRPLVEKRAPSRPAARP